MNSLFVLLVLVGSAISLPQFGGRAPAYRPRPPVPAPPAYRPPAQTSPGKIVLIVKQNQDITPDGSFQYDFEADNGIAAQSQGVVKNAGSNNEIQAVSGSYSYPGDDGRPVVVTYTADENGYVAQSDIIPTPPPIPPEILKALEYLRTLPPSKDDQRK